MTSKQILSLLFLILSMVPVKAQDVVFSQFFAAPLELNPALTGLTHEPRIILNYRNQWPALPNAYVTYSASYDQYFYKVNSGIGANILSDIEGDGIYQTNRIDLSYAYDLRMNENLYLRGGLEGGVVQRRLDWDKLLFLDQLDPINGPTDPAGNPYPTEEERPDNLTRSYFDFSAGLLAYSPHFYAGLTLKHINAPDESILDVETDFAQRPILYSFHAGAELVLVENNKRQTKTFISPNVILAKQTDFYQVNVGAYFRTWYLFGGAWYRHTFTNPDAAILLVGFQKDVLKVGYSYDLTLSDLSSYTAGGHEISVVLNFDETEWAKRKRNQRKYTDCLRMFR